ncbi:hypothetical protein PAPYR_23 [Paratrimastix pyriformis]|uniref:E2F/DP family winged-helix DNA-binding domain-containing protein n=1 Tax=Paratrimastix pyriformis TaxID=342808 RepID=A0ABQ8UW73_9EUKA|nr:hypothetical protein PAPYR_23 [Paratrimastix pyriformis]
MEPQRTGKGKEGLEDATMKIVHLLQQHGMMGFKEIHEALKIDYRRAYDILNVLLTTPLLDKKGKKRDSRAPYVYQDGIPLSEPCEVDNVGTLIAQEQQQANLTFHRLKRLEQILLSPDPPPNPAALYAEFYAEDPSIAHQPHFMQFVAPPSPACSPQPAPMAEPQIPPFSSPPTSSPHMRPHPPYPYPPFGPMGPYPQAPFSSPPQYPFMPHPGMSYVYPPCKRGAAVTLV